jgi:hypothetical protein
MSKRTSCWSGSLIVTLTLAACGGGNPAPPAFDATGSWMTWIEDPNTLEESGPFGNYVIANTAGILDGVGLTGQVSGNNVYMSVDIGVGVLTFSGVMATNEVAGTVQFSGVPLTAGFRMQLFTPTGTLTGDGTVGGTTVAADTATAFCERKYSDIALTTLTAVNVWDDDGVTRFGLGFVDPGSLAVGAIDASVVPIDVTMWNDVVRADIRATSGTVTVTQYDAGGFVATYDLTLPGAESVTGSFDVVFDLDAYEP